MERKGQAWEGRSGQQVRGTDFWHHIFMTLYPQYVWSSVPNTLYLVSYPDHNPNFQLCEISSGQYTITPSMDKQAAA